MGSSILLDGQNIVDITEQLVLLITKFPGGVSGFFVLIATLFFMPFGALIVSHFRFALTTEKFMEIASSSTDELQSIGDECHATSREMQQEFLSALERQQKGFDDAMEAMRRDFREDRREIVGEIRSMKEMLLVRSALGTNGGGGN